MDTMFTTQVWCCTCRSYKEVIFFFFSLEKVCVWMAKDLRMLKSNHIYTFVPIWREAWSSVAQVMKAKIKTFFSTYWFILHTQTYMYFVLFYVIKSEYSYLWSGFSHLKIHVGFLWMLISVQSNTRNSGDSIQKLFPHTLAIRASSF